MPLPRFDFAPHEWPPLGIGPREGLADAVFRAVWDGEEVEVMAREVRCAPGYLLLFFGFLGASATPWVVSDSVQPRPFKFLCGEEDMGERVQEALNTHYFGRTFLYKTEMFGPQWLYLSHDGKRGCWNGAGTRGISARFRLELEQSLEEAMKDADSDARFAWWWAQQTDECRMEVATRFSRGSFAELHKIVCALATLEESEQRCSHLWFSGEFGYDDDCRHQPNAQLQGWAKYLKHLFVWDKNFDLATRHLCIAYFFVGTPVYIEIPAQPSQHERLEAALFLREWGRGKIPPDELALLLPKL